MRRVVGFVVVLVVLLVACSSGSLDEAATTTGGPAPTTATTAPDGSDPVPVPSGGDFTDYGMPDTVLHCEMARLLRDASLAEDEEGWRVNYEDLAFSERQTFGPELMAMAGERDWSLRLAGAETMLELCEAHGY